VKQALALLLFATAAAQRRRPRRGRTLFLLELFTARAATAVRRDGFWKSSTATSLSTSRSDRSSEHVDYWNHPAGPTPIRPPNYQRQRDYAARVHSSDVYTPQLFVDGAKYSWAANADAAREALPKPRARETGTHSRGAQGRFEGRLQLVVPSARVRTCSSSCHRPRR